MKEETKEIFSALVEFQKYCPAIELDSNVDINGKTKAGKDYKVTFKYASLANIIKTIKPVLSNNGLAFTHLVGSEGVTCVLMHESGQSIQSPPYKLNAGNDPKDQGASITYNRRYSLCAILGICAEDDTDAPAPSSGKKPLGEKAFKQAMEKIKEGNLNTMVQCLLHFELTQDQMQKLLELSIWVGGQNNEGV